MAGKLTSEQAKELGKKGGLANKGKKHKKTLLKESIGIKNTDKILKKIEKNINKAINDPKLWFDATKAFTDYYKPRKRESNVKVEGTVNFVVNKSIVKKDET